MESRGRGVLDPRLRGDDDPGCGDAVGKRTHPTRAVPFDGREPAVSQPRLDRGRDSGNKSGKAVKQSRTRFLQCSKHDLASPC